MMKTFRSIKIAAGLAILLAMSVFASGQASAWTLSADFEKGTVGQRAQGASGWDFAGTSTFFSSAQAAHGTKSAAINWSAGSEGYGASHGEWDGSYPSIPNGGEFWARAYMYFPTNWKWNCSPVIKVLRGIQQGGGYMSIFAGPSGEIILSNEPAQVQISTSTKFSLGQWQCIEMYVKLGSPGIFRIWKDGVLVIENTASTSGSGNRALFMTNWNGGSPQAQTQYMDDVVITTDRPSQVDIKGNPMIGPIGGTSDSTTTTTPTVVTPPAALRVTN
jgi:hypothetical protein